MVANSQNYGSSSKGAFHKNGVYDWVVQRKTAVFLAAFFIYLAYFFYNNNPLEYNNWLGLFQPVLFKVFTVVFLICLIRHAWVGLWVIATDYISCLKFRAVFLGFCKTVLIGYLVWGIYILFLI